METQIMKKRHLSASILAAFVLSACSLGDTGTEVTQIFTSSTSGTVQAPKKYSLAASHWSDVAKLRAKANELGTQVGSGKITKVQAAKLLDRYRVSLVGHNTVDDSVYQVYLKAAVDSQRGEINQEQSRAYIENAVRGWQQRWKNMEDKPRNPAFTNFLLEHLGMQPLR
ncbi:hypothetical protein [Kingella negevensis]|uniref:hypothetical protein n=2 Tax=Kingella negevensis TaxID=1522312 RepID=UPI00050A1066